MFRLRAAPQALRGRGGHKKWTGAAITDAGFAPPELPSRAVSKCRGASTRKCAFFLADMIESRQQECDKDRWCHNMDNPMQFYITNMSDATQLYIAAPGGHRTKRHRTIAHGCHITYKQPGDNEVVDMDVSRPPGLMMSCNAATLAGVVGEPTDTCGIAPEGCLPLAPKAGTFEKPPAAPLPPPPPAKVRTTANPAPVPSPTVVAGSTQPCIPAAADAPMPAKTQVHAPPQTSAHTPIGGRGTARAIFAPVGDPVEPAPPKTTETIVPARTTPAAAATLAPAPMTAPGDVEEAVPALPAPGPTPAP